MFIGHDFRAVESRKNINEKFGGFRKLSVDKVIDSFVDFKFVLSFPISTFFKEDMTFVNVLFDFINILKLQMDGTEFEMDIHFLTNFNGFLQSQSEGSNSFIILFVLNIDFSLGKKCISDLSVSKVLLSIFDFGIGFCNPVLKTFFNVHFKLFLNYKLNPYPLWYYKIKKLWWLTKTKKQMN